MRELFHAGCWLAHTYARRTKPASGLTFDQAALPRSSAVPAQTLAQIQALEAKLKGTCRLSSRSLLYETPFIDFHHAGPNGLFPSAKVEELLAVLEHVRTMATAA